MSISQIHIVHKSYECMCMESELQLTREKKKCQINFFFSTVGGYAIATVTF